MATQPGDPDASALAEADLAAIRGVLEKYLACADLADHDAMAECFTDDAILSYDVLPHRFVGGRALADWVAAFHERTDSQGTHVMGNATIGEGSPRVPVISHVVANQAIPSDSGYVVKVRGIRYDDEFVETSQGWRIARRTHIPLWQYELPGDPLTDVAAS